ncbi:hypothetical protein [Ferrimonas marina]|uniref:hypothetical protein n=1 Tax=Ferrimonas marina TaxID=299255 RepID=UPI000AE93AFA|nr:hypothetical protein [Ferrimonas marina]
MPLEGLEQAERSDSLAELRESLTDAFSSLWDTKVTVLFDFGEAAQAGLEAAAGDKP